MKNIFLALAAGFAAGYLFRKMQEEHKFDPVVDCANEFASKAKQKVKDVSTLAQHEAGSLKDRAEQFIGKEKAKLAAALSEKGSDK